MESTNTQQQNNAPNKNNKRRGNGGKPRGGAQVDDKQTERPAQSQGGPRAQAAAQVVKVASEAGFVGPSKDWFNGKSTFQNPLLTSLQMRNSRLPPALTSQRKTTTITTAPTLASTFTRRC